jgi:hypothetical protein
MEKKLTEVEIGEFGEKRVEIALIEMGHTNIIRNTRLPGSTDIETDTWLVQVKASQFPNDVRDLTPGEVHDIKSRATRLKKEAYKVQLIINENGLLVGKIKFTDLFEGEKKAREKALKDLQDRN